MRVRHFVMLLLAEAWKTFTRGSGIAAVLVALAVAALAAVGMQVASDVGAGATVNGQPASGFLRTSGLTVFTWALQGRNFFVLPMLLLWATGASMAGEIGDHSLRAHLVRPVPRLAVLAAKFGALLLLSAATLLLGAVTSALVGGAMFGFEGEWGPVVLAWLASGLTDAGLVALGLLASLFFRSVGGVVVGVVLFLMLDLGLRAILKLAGVLGVQASEALLRWMPGEALAAWEGFEGGWDPYAFLGLALLLLVVLAVSSARFMRMDIP